MPYVDNGQRTHNIAHCQHCKWEWVMPPDTKGKRGTHDNTFDGQRCPYCGSTKIRYSQEDNR